MGIAAIETDLRILLHMRHSRDIARRLGVRSLIRRDIEALRRMHGKTKQTSREMFAK